MALAAQHRLPLIRVHHMEAHALVARLKEAYQPIVLHPPTPVSPQHHTASPLTHVQAPQTSSPSSFGGTSSSTTDSHSSSSSISLDSAAVDGIALSGVPFPFLCLLVSGGHNLVVLVQGVGQYVQLGTTVDDALGESWVWGARVANVRENVCVQMVPLVSVRTQGSRVTNMLENVCE
jgi:N6-L-threonylcarbamoyladenine synthase